MSCFTEQKDVSKLCSTVYLLDNILRLTIYILLYVPGFPLIQFILCRKQRLRRWMYKHQQNLFVS